MPPRHFLTNLLVIKTKCFRLNFNDLNIKTVQFTIKVLMPFIYVKLEAPNLIYKIKKQNVKSNNFAEFVFSSMHIYSDWLTN